MEEESFLSKDNSDVWTEWLTRVVVALALVLVYHFYTRHPAKEANNTAGHSLQDDWKAKRLQSLEERLLEKEKILEQRLQALERQQDEVRRRHEESFPNDSDMYEESFASPPAQVDDAAENERDPTNVDAHPNDDYDELNIGDEPPPQPDDKPSIEVVAVKDELDIDDEPPPKQDEEKKYDDDDNEKEEKKTFQFPLEPKKGTSKTVGREQTLVSNSIHETTAQRRLGRPPPEIRRQRRQQQQQQAISSSLLPEPIAAVSHHHPGLEQFYHWYNVETSLYRIYELGRTDGVPVVPPYHPKSERGNVRVSLVVGNKLYVPIYVYWVDYKGKEITKGKIPPAATWEQTTWIGHPWVFRTADGKLLLHYIPYRIIPTTRQVPTVDPNDPETGLHQFVIGGPHPTDDVYSCSVHDPVLPHPPQVGLNTPTRASQWTLQHMARTDYVDGELLAKYLTNIVSHPDNVKYRQIRTAHAKFYKGVWNSAARGLLLAAGFVERHAFLELGTMEPLSRERVRDISLLLFAVEQWRNEQEQDTVTNQPEGADGFGRAGYGRAGEMNLG